MRSSLLLLYWFHAHKCPMSTLGYRAGIMAKKLLKLKRTDYRIAVAKLFFRSCAIDGVQISFPTTFGNGNLIVTDDKDMRFEFLRTDKNKKIVVKFSKRLLDLMNEYLSARNMLGDVKNKDIEKQVKQKYNKFLDFTQKGKDEEIFVVE